MSIIGIDLGTSNSAAAVLRGGRPVIIPSVEGVSLGGKAFPSYVAVSSDGQILVGEPARRQAAANPEGTATAFKRKMGRRELIWLRDREFSPEQLSAFLIDVSGILDVTAKDTATGKSQSLRITGSTRLSEEEKRRMYERLQALTSKG